MKKRIKCGWLFTAENEDVQQDMEILIEGEQILKIGKMGAFDGESAETIDLRNQFVMPA